MLPDMGCFIAGAIFFLLGLFIYDFVLGIMPEQHVYTSLEDPWRLPLIHAALLGVSGFVLSVKQDLEDTFAEKNTTAVLAMTKAFAATALVYCSGVAILWGIHFSFLKEHGELLGQPLALSASQPAVHLISLFVLMFWLMLTMKSLIRKCRIS